MFFFLTSGGIPPVDGVRSNPIDLDPPDDCTFAPRLHRSCTEKVQTPKAEERGRNEYSIERRENSLSHNSILHRNWDAHTTPDDPVTVGACV